MPPRKPDEPSMDVPTKSAAMTTVGRWVPVKFTSSDRYWEERYGGGGNSGAGSYGQLAAFKAEVLNEFVARHEITSVIEFGSGDGNQLTLARYPSYTGVDVSPTVVRLCREKFSQDNTKTFLTTAEYDGRRAELSMSLDVIYHLVEDEVYEAHMATLFDAAERFVIVYSSNWDQDDGLSRHLRHRRFSDWVAINRPTFGMKAHIPNRFPFDSENAAHTSFADFYVFELGR